MSAQGSKIGTGLLREIVKPNPKREEAMKRITLTTKVLDEWRTKLDEIAGCNFPVLAFLSGICEARPDGSFDSELLKELFDYCESVTTYVHELDHEIYELLVWHESTGGGRIHEQSQEKEAL